MSKPQLFRKPGLIGLLLGTVVVTFPLLMRQQPSVAQSFNPSEAVLQQYQLPYRTDRGTAKAIDTYRLRVTSKEITPGVFKFIIAYPESYNGSFDPKKVQVFVNRENQPLASVDWDQDARVLELELEDPLAKAVPVEIILSNVVNPTLARERTQFDLECYILTNAEPNKPKYIGTWPVVIVQ